MTTILKIYKAIITLGEPLLKMVLQTRLTKGKEDSARLNERMGVCARQRPQGKLIWIHAASVGEAQSALILIDKIGRSINDAHILVTTGTVTSAALMEQRLPSFAFHQFIPLDHPKWVDSFLNHWQPNLAIWMESELWPNTIMAIKSRKIPAILMNARLSDKSFFAWKFFLNSANHLLSCFNLVLAQTQNDASRFQILGGINVHVMGNLKFSALPLPFDETALKSLKDEIDGRPLWLYASTHDGEEELAFNIHKKLKLILPNILTIIVPRHPSRRGDIESLCQKMNLVYTMRSRHLSLPSQNDDVYIADTLGDLGLFYSLSSIAVIGRSFSHDGGGGHNPLEAAQMGCAVLTGPNNQFQRTLYDDMERHDVVIETNTHDELYNSLKALLVSQEKLDALRQKTKIYASQKSHIIDNVMDYLTPYMGNKS